MSLGEVLQGNNKQNKSKKGKLSKNTAENSKHFPLSSKATPITISPCKEKNKLYCEEKHL